MRRVSFPRRYTTFFVVGFVVEACRLLAFALLSGWPSWVANASSLALRFLVAFALNATFTWSDRPGGWRGKFGRFFINKGGTTLIKIAGFPLWLIWLPCPLYGLVCTILDGLPFLGWLANLVTCELLSAALMDLVVALSISFFLHDRISFVERRNDG